MSSRNKASWGHIMIGLALCVPFTTWGLARGYNSMMFDIKCGGHIKRAADANTTETAVKELETVVAYLEAHKMTEGNTAALQFLWTPPDRDVGFWYGNIKSSLAELKKLNSEADVEKRDVKLLKLRQTLMDHSEQGEGVTVPPGISVFPHNVLYFVWCWVGLGVALIGGCFFLYGLPSSFFEG